MRTQKIYSNYTDVELLNLFVNGDQFAYTEIYRRYHRVCIAYAYKKLQDEELTKDIVQDIFVKLWIKRAHLNIKSNLPGYLITAVKNSILNTLQREETSARYLTSLADFVNTGEMAHTDHLVRDREWKKHIDNAIETLPKKMRTAFILNKKEHLSYAETAKKLNTTENNIQKHINGALKILKTKLKVIF